MSLAESDAEPYEKCSIKIMNTPYIIHLESLHHSRDDVTLCHLHLI